MMPGPASREYDPRDYERDDDRDRDRDRDRPRRRDRDPPPPTPPPTTKRGSITDRLIGSFNQVRNSTAASIQRRASSATRSPPAAPIARIREWLDTCNIEHNSHCTGSDEIDASAWFPAYLVDTVERRLVRAKYTDRYMALSYVWGTGLRRNGPDSVAQLLRSNVDAYQLALPNADAIPQTILDAMWLTKKLGMRHIWIDRLCIVQDDDADRDRHIRNMPFIFANAYLTVIAAHGDVTSGLVSLNPRRSQTRPVRPNVRDHDDLLLNSTWNKRGWTLQELLYSRRAVFFFEETITWECHCDLWQGSTTSIIKMVKSSRQDPCTNRICSSAFGFQHASWPDMDEYARIVTDYSARRLTYVEDTLRAFSGITTVLSRVFPGGFVYGMPLMFLDIALLWRPQASIRRRAVARPPFLPSWSWMGWWFDGVPVDVVLWRAAADYVSETKSGSKRGQASKRFQPQHLFRIKPTIRWNMTDRSASVPVPNNGLQFRELKSRRNASAALPPGWSRSGSRFKHDSDDTTAFKYPVPIEEPPAGDEYERPTGELAFPGPLLQFRTNLGLFDVDFAATMAPKDRPNPTIAIGSVWSRAGAWIGELRSHDGWLGIQGSNYDGDEKLEFIAISTAMERKGSYIFAGDKFEEHMDSDGIVDVVNVLWIERIGGVSYRRGIGHILLKAWEAHTTDEVDILLG